MEPDSKPEPWSRDWWLRLLRDSFGPNFWLFLGIALLMGGICYWNLGPEAFEGAIASDRQLLGSMLPRLAAAQVVAGLIWVLMPRERFSRLLGSGNDSRRGLVIATAAGIITPGGPSAAFPILAIIAGAGADRGILVAYITSWALIGAQRIIVWDIPLMGAEFSALRFAVCLPLPLVAGMIARRLPFSASLEQGAPGARAVE